MWWAGGVAAVLRHSDVRVNRESSTFKAGLCCLLALCDLGQVSYCVCVLSGFTRV